MTEITKVDPYTQGVSNKVTGTYTGDATSMKLEINTTITKAIPISGGTFSYYKPGLKTSDVVYALLCDSVGQTLDREQVVIKTTSSNITYIKTFVGISNAIKVYDEVIVQLRQEALGELKIAGVSTDETDPQVKAYISSYCRLHMISEPSKIFIDSEEERLLKIIRQLTYGG